MQPTSELNIPIITGRAPASPNGAIPGTAGLTSTLHANLTSEYVSGSAYALYAQYLKALPWAASDIEADFGDDVLDRMQIDPQIAADVIVLKASILEDGLNLTSAVDDKTDDGYDLARTICDTLTKNLERLNTSIDDVLWNMLDAVPLGSRVAEQVYEFDSMLGKRGLWLQALKVKPRRSTAFLVDPYNNIVGLLAQMPTAFSPVQIGMVLTDPAMQPNLIPREKFAVMTFRPVDNDPRGTSIIRPAYRPWWLKQQVIGEYLKYLTQFASPTVLGFTDPEAQAQALTDALGNPLLDTKGNVLYVKPEQTMFDALVQWRNGGLGVFRGGATVQFVQSAGDGNAFLNALLECNKEISKAILTQTLATEEGEHQARAAAEVHQDVLDTIVRQGKRGLTRMLVRDVFAPLVKYNWGDAAVDLVPKVSFGETTMANFAANAAAVAHLWSVGFYGKSQLAGLDKFLGSPERDQAADDADATPVIAGAPSPAVATIGEPPQPKQLPVAPAAPITPTHAVEAKAA